MTIASLLVGFTIGFSTDVTKRDDQVAKRRLLWILASSGWCALVLLVIGWTDDLENPLLSYASGTLLGLLTREYHRAGAS